MLCGDVVDTVIGRTFQPGLLFFSHYPIISLFFALFYHQRITVIYRPGDWTAETGMAVSGTFGPPCPSVMIEVRWSPVVMVHGLVIKPGLFNLLFKHHHSNWMVNPAWNISFSFPSVRPAICVLGRARHSTSLEVKFAGATAPA